MDTEGLGTEGGGVLLSAVFVVLILTLLGTVSINLATQEIQQVSARADAAAARFLADAGSEAVIRWFHQPDSSPMPAVPLLTKRFELPDGTPSYFDGSGASQFTGSASNPDLVLNASLSTEDAWLNHPASGFLQGLNHLGRLETIKVYAPSRPGLLCTVEVTAKAKAVRRTQSVQLGALTLPSVRAGVQVGRPPMPPLLPLALWVHWGDVAVKGPVFLGKREELPVKTSTASVTGHSYAEMSHPEDRWFDLRAGGDVVWTPDSTGTAALPSNVYPHQDPVPGLRYQSLPYETLKQYAMRYGRYYALGEDGLVYPNGIVSSGQGVQLEEVMRSASVGDNRGLVFVDTLDGLPPRADNLGTIRFDTEYAEGLFIIHAHVHWKVSGPGRSVPSLSPPEEGSSSAASRIPVTLSGIHLNGFVSISGDLVYEGRPRLFGALMVEGAISASSPSTPLELWYNHDFSRGLFRGVPVVYLCHQSDDFGKTGVGGNCRERLKEH
ncbi:hypothetical protein [Candidatus Nitrospira bockiana]